MQQVKAVVALAKGEPVQLTTINVPDPGPGEAVVKVQACVVCHTDLHYREGGINDDFPFLLGHEAAGVVEAVGPDVTGLEPGDFVVLNWRAVCGSCRACNRGEPWYCFATHNATQKMTLAEGELAGTELSPALGIGAFAEKTLVAAGQCTKVDPSARAAAVGLLGCGVMAGLGAAINTGNVGRGSTVAVIGCGGVGAAAIAGAALAGASRIIAVDIDDRKLELARSMGATHTVNSQETDPVAAIRELTPPPDGTGHEGGADVVVVGVRAHDRLHRPAGHDLEDRVDVVRGVNHEALLVVADHPDVVVDVVGLPVEAERPRDDGVVDAGAHRTTTERSTPPECIVSKAASTSPRPISSLTKASRSSRPCW